MEETPEDSPEAAAFRLELQALEESLVVAKADVESLAKIQAPLAHRAVAVVKNLEHKLAKAKARARAFYGIGEERQIAMPSVDTVPVEPVEQSW